MLNVVIRTFIVYALIILSLRLMGKRQLGELQPNELVTTILISNLASLPVEDTNLPMLPSLVPIFLIVSLEIIVSCAEIKFPGFSKMISGSSKIVIENGRINEAVLKQLRYSVEDLLEALRNKNVFDIGIVEYAIIETNGNLNLYKKPDFREVENKDLGIDLSDFRRPPQAVLIDGEIQKEAAEFCGLDAGEIDRKLESVGLSAENVLLLQCGDNRTDIIVERNTRA